MGLYAIDCPECKKPFMWFSGNLPDQRCGECKTRGIIPIEPVITWYCNSCAVEVPKGDRCKHCGKTKREKT